MFQFGRFPTYTYEFSIRLSGIPLIEFPHSDTCGSKLICSSPQLFAAYRVLLRLPMPRHSPCALSSLNLHELRKSRLKCSSAFCSCFTTLTFGITFYCYPVCHLRKYWISLLLASRFAFTPFVLFSFQSTIWWAQVGSNHRPRAYQARALAC